MGIEFLAFRFFCSGRFVPARNGVGTMFLAELNELDRMKDLDLSSLRLTPYPFKSFH